MVTVQALPRIPSIRDYTYCQFEEDAFAISADSLDGNNSLLWFRSSGAVDTLKTLPAPSTINDGVSFRYVQQYNPITGCASPMDTAIINILKLPSAPFTQPIDLTAIIGADAFRNTFREHTCHDSFILKTTSDGCGCYLSEKLYV